MRQDRRHNLNGNNSPIIIDLKASKVIKEVPAYQITIDKVEIVSYVDSPVNKTVIAYTKGFPGEILLWEGDAYDKIGQCKDSDVSKRIQELYK